MWHKRCSRSVPTTSLSIREIQRFYCLKEISHTDIQSCITLCISWPHFFAATAYLQTVMNEFHVTLLLQLKTRIHFYFITKAATTLVIKLEHLKKYYQVI